MLSELKYLVLFQISYYLLWDKHKGEINVCLMSAGIDRLERLQDGLLQIASNCCGHLPQEYTTQVDIQGDSGLLKADWGRD